MRKMLLGAAACVLGLAGTATAQFPGYGGMMGGFGGGYGGYGGFGGYGGMMGGYGGGMFMPNIFNSQTQPLSPYLNMFRNNPATNYYFGTRPGTVGGAGRFGGAPFMAMGGMRPPFPIEITPEEAPQLQEPEEGYALPPAGHAVVYGNTLGYFPSPFGMYGYGRGGMMRGMGGMGGMGMGMGAGAGRTSSATRR